MKNPDNPRRPVGTRGSIFVPEPATLNFGMFDPNPNHQIRVELVLFLDWVFVQLFLFLISFLLKLLRYLSFSKFCNKYYKHLVFNI